MQAIPFWLWPNALSLDAPLIAVAWQGLLAQTTGTVLRPAGRVILFLTVWLIYIVDRLLDARQPALGVEPVRHRFYRLNWNRARNVAALILAVDLALIFGELHPAVFRAGLMVFAGVCLYLLVLHGTKFPVPKEAAVALLFTVGTFLVALTRFTGPVTALAPAALSFFSLCLANLVAIDHWEQGTDSFLSRWYVWWVPALAALGLLVTPGHWTTAVAIGAGALTAIYTLGAQWHPEKKRALVDAALLVPPLLLR